MKISKILLPSFLLFSWIFLVGCDHTVQGFGADMQQNGQKIENSANQK